MDLVLPDIMAEIDASDIGLLDLDISMLEIDGFVLHVIANVLHINHVSRHMEWNVYPVLWVELDGRRVIMACVVEEETVYFEMDVDLGCACRLAGRSAPIKIGPYVQLTSIRERSILVLRSPEKDVDNLIIEGNVICIESIHDETCICVTRSNEAVKRYRQWQIFADDEPRTAWSRELSRRYRWQLFGSSADDGAMFETPITWHRHQTRIEPIIINGSYVAENDGWVNLFTNDGYQHDGHEVLSVNDNTPLSMWTVEDMQTHIHLPNSVTDPYSFVEVSAWMRVATHRHIAYAVEEQTIQVYDMHRRCMIRSFSVDNGASTSIKSICVDDHHIAVCRRNDNICIHRVSDGALIDEYTSPGHNYTKFMCFVSNNLVWLSDTSNIFVRNFRKHYTGCKRIFNDPLPRILALHAVAHDRVVIVTNLSTTLVSMPTIEIIHMVALNRPVKKGDKFRFAVSCDGSKVAVRHGTAGLRVRSYLTCQVVKIEMESDVSSFHFMPSKADILLVCTSQNTCSLVDATTGTVYTTVRILAGIYGIAALASNSVMLFTQNLQGVVQLPNIPHIVMALLVLAQRRRNLKGWWLPDELWQEIYDEFIKTK